MKHYSMCIECNELKVPGVVWAAGELTNDLYAICICPHGHKSLSGLMHHVPDVLFMSAVRAFRSECYSESILSFTVAFERTCELFFKAFCLKQGANIDLIEQMWKELENQSERQYGSFCIAYCITAGNAWKANANQVKFRNRVVHKGYIATKLEATTYASYITTNIDLLITLLHKKFDKECTEIYFDSKNKNRIKLQKIIDKTPNLKFSATSFPSLLGWNHGDRQSVSFADVLQTASELELKFGF
jgi:hypothetical protein